MSVEKNGTKIEFTQGSADAVQAHDRTAGCVQACYPMKDYFEIDVISGDAIGIGLTPVEPKRPNNDVQPWDW